MILTMDINHPRQTTQTLRVMSSKVKTTLHIKGTTSLNSRRRPSLNAQLPNYNNYNESSPESQDLIRSLEAA